MARKLLPDKEIGERVYEDVQWSRDFRRDRREDWLRFYKLFKNYIDAATYPFEANLAIPTGYTVVEVQTSFLLDMVFESGDFVEVLGKTPNGQASAKAVKDMLNYHFRHSFNIYEDMEKFIRQLLMYGTSVYKVFWRYKPGWTTRSILQTEEETGQPEGYENVLVPEILENKPYGYTVDLYNFGIDPNAADITCARYAFEEMYVDPMSLVERQQLGLYKNVQRVLAPAANVNESLSDRLEEIDITSHQDSPYVERGKVHLIDWWGYLTKGWKGGKLSKTAKSQLYHVVLALAQSSHGGEGEPVVLLAEPSPFHHNRIPFIDARLNGCVGEFYGTGDIEYTESLLLEQRDMRNLQLDNLNRTVNKMFFVQNNMNVDEGELVWRPSGVVHGDEPGSIAVLDPGTIDPAVFRSQDELRRDIEQVTGVNDFIMGQYRSSTGFNDTATGISLVQQVALKRIGHKGQIVQRAIRDIGSMTFALVAQYQPFGTSVRILDRESATQYRFVDISPQALAQEYDFNIVNAPALGSKPLRQNQLIQLLQIATQVKSVDPKVQFDFARYMRRTLDEMDVPNPDEFFSFSQFNAPLAEMLGEPADSGELLDPEEENRLMMEQYEQITPKMEENHPHHMYVHQAAYEGSLADDEAKRLLENHYNAHAVLAKETQNLLGQALGTEMLRQGVSEQQNLLNFLEGGNTKSPTGAGGQEDVIRALGNLGAGNT